MELYYKEYNKFPVRIPKNSVIMRDWDVDCLKSNYPDHYPVPLCLEVDGINKINRNEDGFFDFSKCIIDVGANLGEYCWDTNFVHAYAFEPNKESAYALCANALLWEKSEHIDVYMDFLSNKEKEVRFNGFDSLNVDEYTPIVNAKTLDSYGFVNIGLIKIDVENHEFEVLCGARKTIVSNNFPPIIFECFDVGVFGMTEERHRKTFGFLEQYGYTIHKYWIDRNTHLAVRSASAEPFTQDHAYDTNGNVIGKGDIVLWTDSETFATTAYEVYEEPTEDMVKLWNDFGECEALPSECIVVLKNRDKLANQPVRPK